MTTSNQHSEHIPRQDIDRMLTQPGWVIQDAKRDETTASLGSIIRDEEQSASNLADYALYIDGKTCSFIEVQKQGASLGGVAALQHAKKLLAQYYHSIHKSAVTGKLTKESGQQNKAELEPAVFRSTDNKTSLASYLTRIKLNDSIEPWLHSPLNKHSYG